MTDEQKDRLLLLTGGALAGMAIAFIICKVYYDKRIWKLEEKIMQLEGWQ